MHLPEVFLGLLFLRKYRLTGAHLLPRNIYHVNLATLYCVLYRLLTCVLNTISTPAHIFAMRPNTRLPLVCLILAHISSLPDFPPTYLNLCISVHREHEFCAVAKMLILTLYTIYFYLLTPLQRVCVFFQFILYIKFVGRTSRGHTGGRSQDFSSAFFLRCVP